jgi:nitrogen fixation NifU-like protein
VGTGLVGAPECGIVMRLQIEVDDATALQMQRSLKLFLVTWISHCIFFFWLQEWLKGKA